MAEPNPPTIQTGWSVPPPLRFFDQVAPQYKDQRSDMSKQWHYKIDLQNCSDPAENGYGKGLLTNIDGSSRTRVGFMNRTNNIDQ